MMRGARPSSSTKKLAKVSMTSTCLGFDKVRNVKEFLLEVNNYYDLERPGKNEKVSIVMTFLKDHMLSWWISKRKKNPRW